MDYWITAQGACEPWTLPPEETSSAPGSYRLYRFLTEVEDLLAIPAPLETQMRSLLPKLRRLLDDNLWLHLLPLTPDPTSGWDLTMLYDEPDYPLTVQMVAWTPGTVSPVHNHGGWGIVALLRGQERNQFWTRQTAGEARQASDSVSFVPLEETGTIVLEPGDIIAFDPEAIHRITALSDQPTVSFNLYGPAQYDQRFEFDLTHNQAQLY
jgi:predicted metal-dependent enzyme (double-stranded beta helix superfamily)